MSILTKAEACRELAVSLSTLDRRIASGEVRTRREPRGRRHRVYVMLDDDLPNAVETPQSELAVAQEQVRGLEEQVTFLQEQLELERQRNAELVSELKAAQEQRGPRWRFWPRWDGDTKVQNAQDRTQPGILANLLGPKRHDPHI